jgi:hypothetical protein
MSSEHSKHDIWDVHCHLSGVPGSTPEERLGNLIRYADRMGIARLCVFMGMEWSYDPSPEDFRRANDEVLRAVRAFPDRAFGFVYLNPKHTQASLDELNRCVRTARWWASSSGSPSTVTVQSSIRWSNGQQT